MHIWSEVRALSIFEYSDVSRVSDSLETRLTNTPFFLNNGLNWGYPPRIFITLSTHCFLFLKSYLGRAKAGGEAFRDRALMTSMRFDGEPLKLPGCTGDGFSEDGTGCTYTEFKALIADVWYSGKYADDLDKACFQPVTDADLQPE